MRQYAKPVFTEKHFNVLAQELGGILSKLPKYDIDDGSLYFAIGYLSEYFRKDNPKFDAQKFLMTIKEAAKA